jgi:NAD(P)-dependent dehydrogenase (short-subunit alcohol dehydrogenase family)
MTRLSDRVALVTGSLRGIGLAVAQRYLTEGAKVVLSDMADAGHADVVAVLKDLGPDASYISLDVTLEDAWQAAEKAIRASHGRLDIMVNNAGIDGTGPVEDMDFALWRKVMAVNVDGVFLGIKTFTPLMSETGKTTPFGSSIINMASIMGLVGYADTAPYNASKGAVRLLTKAVAIEFATKRTPIRVNSLHPGFVHTPLLQIGFQNWVNLGMAEKVQDLVDMTAEATPVGRLAEASEIAGAAFFLASDDSSYCTGSELVIDGGWTAR